MGQLRRVLQRDGKRAAHQGGGVPRHDVQDFLSVSAFIGGELHLIDAAADFVRGLGARILRRPLDQGANVGLG